MTCSGNQHIIVSILGWIWGKWKWTFWKDQSFSAIKYIPSDFVFVFCTIYYPFICSVPSIYVELCPLHYDCFKQPRVSGRSGGLVGVYRKSFKYYKVTCDEFASFEFLSLHPITFAIIYRPPKPTGSFLAELPELFFVAILISMLMTDLMMLLLF